MRLEEIAIAIGFALMLSAPIGLLILDIVCLPPRPQSLPIELSSRDTDALTTLEARASFDRFSRWDWPL